VTDAPYRAGSSDALVIDDVSKRYGRQPALDHIDHGNAVLRSGARVRRRDALRPR
jgi:hypothetical protein